MSNEHEGGFGLAFVRQEGAPVHPDDVLIAGYLTGDKYDEQLRRYKEYHGLT